MCRFTSVWGKILINRGRFAGAGRLLRHSNEGLWEKLAGWLRVEVGLLFAAYVSLSTTGGNCVPKKWAVIADRQICLEAHHP